MNEQQNLEELYNLILDRKNNPIKGSYTDYLFTKGLDKILKKVGEESTEVIVAAKNPDKSEIQYEMADLLYHLMVLLVEQGVPFEKIKEELASREGKMSKLKERRPIEKL
ncbi:phosphoribosyl-ATP diphosphatase [Limosilactobacillus reuteri]|uniref:Phosphoribosyl-ATP pyrophosphatase n=2 Tax=Limosilactobacillus reuteri TaxID=1598 RepID=A0ABD6Y4L0_LIMRT|nr:phosphoribosyl-ATP diphosphatase [Limosilactobacillus reuteri]MCC4468189.1 phosphoribosyl-ATP diphosphatase [Limosilactobacillus reuteri]MCC4472109.1 phosphoribosyl-ATP diphosphatase [Limosilactobacillus reuteri]MCT3190338.1 phosphoribosyl-ATP diphosphatase [Limosilactobacillus reuteri]MCT3196788.1 phosphoribosyl-ATP diphosphatase [Limosilactobacillus reuteri]MDC6077226.1 phosphoribosyl-ATP diphosphatase [Limosilactobacillus reuteri]